MKKLFTLTLALALVGISFAQVKTTDFPTPTSGKIVATTHGAYANPASLQKMKAARHHQAPSSRAQNIAFTLENYTADYLYSQVITTDYYDDVIFQFNRGLPVDSDGILKWGFQWYPSIFTYDDANPWPLINYDVNNINVSIDTVYLGMAHVNTSGLNDTIQVSIWDYDAMANISFDSGATGTLYGRFSFITDTSITSTSGGGQFSVVDFPIVPASPIVIPQGKHFVVQVDFFGPGQDQFFLIAGRRNDCGNAQCGASVPYINDTYSSNLDSFNSVGATRYVDPTGQQTGIYPLNFFYNDCNASGTQDPDQCERYVLQDWYITQHLQVTIPNFYATITASTPTACPNSLVELTANSAGSPDAPYTYNWSTTSGSLSSTGDPIVTLTAGSSNAVVTVTVTDASNNTTTGTFTVQSKAVNISITNTPQPIEINCGGSGVTISSTISGSTQGKNYTWSTGATGANVPSIQNISSPGVYTVTVTNNSGCSASASVEVIYAGGVTNNVSFTGPSDVSPNPGLQVCQNAPQTFTNTSSNVTGWTASWTYGDGSLGTGTNGTYAYPNVGQYFVTLSMDSASCTFTSTPLTVNVLVASQTGPCATGINDVEFTNAISLLPNPTTGNLNVTVNGVEKNITVKVFNIIGSELINYSANDVASTFNKTFDLSHFANGTYLVKIQTGDKTAVKRVTVAK